MKYSSCVHLQSHRPPLQSSRKLGFHHHVHHQVRTMVYFLSLTKHSLVSDLRFYEAFEDLGDLGSVNFLPQEAADDPDLLPTIA